MMVFNQQQTLTILLRCCLRQGRQIKPISGQHKIKFHLAMNRQRQFVHELMCFSSQPVLALCK